MDVWTGAPRAAEAGRFGEKLVLLKAPSLKGRSAAVPLLQLKATPQMSS